MPERALTDQQRRDWTIDGYLVLRNVLTAAEVKTLVGELREFHPLPRQPLPAFP